MTTVVREKTLHITNVGDEMKIFTYFVNINIDVM